MNDKLQESLDVVVTGSQQTMFLGRARSVSSINRVGPFDVLPQHENFISLIFGRVTVVDESGKKQEFVCEHGLLEVSGNRVQVLVGI